MIKRIIEVSSEPVRLKVKHEQLIISREGVEDQLPCEDVGVLVLDRKDCVYTHSVMSKLLEYGAVIVLCGEDHIPAGILLSNYKHSAFTARQKLQFSLSEPIKKKLWKQIVKEKIKRQAQNIPESQKEHGILLALIDEVKSGDPSNIEGQAARFYWQAIFGKDFRRIRAGMWPNKILDYGYMILRAAVARAVVSAGLNPALGLNHCNGSNAFCLADDLVEPFRPKVDKMVMEFSDRGVKEIDTYVKREVLSLLFSTVEFDNQKGPFLVQLHSLVANLWNCFTRDAKKLNFPVWRD